MVYFCTGRLLNKLMNLFVGFLLKTGEEFRWFSLSEFVSIRELINLGTHITYLYLLDIRISYYTRCIDGTKEIGRLMGE